MRDALIGDPTKDDSAARAEAWLECAEASGKISQEDFESAHAALLRDLVCQADDGRAIGRGIANNWLSGDSSISRQEYSPQIATALARSLLGEDGKECPVAKDYDESTKRLLRAAAGPPLTPPPTTTPAPRYK